MGWIERMGKIFVLMFGLQAFAAYHQIEFEVVPSIQLLWMLQAGIQPDVQLWVARAYGFNNCMVTATPLNGIQIGNVEGFERV